MKNIIFYTFFACVLALYSCDDVAETISSDPNLRLSFSSDSIKFDTVFTLHHPTNRSDTLKSIYKRLTVYNTNKNAVIISQIALNNPAYSAIIHGKKGKSFTNTKLLGKDSLQILVSANINPTTEQLPFLISDLLTFRTNGNTQTVHVVSWGQNANYIPKITLLKDTHWTSDIPYILTDTLVVGSNATLTIDAGTQVYADHLAGMVIGGKLIVNGTHDKRVLFRNLRKGKNYDDLPGQWTGLIFGRKSHDNQINFADIRNAVNGIYFGAPDDNDTPDLIINSCKIENMAGNITAPFIAGYGVLAFTSDIDIRNTLINSCATSSVGLLAGGNYRLDHCTLANFSFKAVRENPTVAISNFVIFGKKPPIKAHLNVTVTNSILWGDITNELQLGRHSDQSLNFNISMSHNLIKTSLKNIPKTNIINKNPRFKAPRKYDYHLTDISPAISKATNSPLTKDLDNIDRTDKPDIGCYEWVQE